jgi:hypothetical protein
MSRNQKYFIAFFSFALMALGFIVSQYALTQHPQQPYSARASASSTIPNFSHIFEIVLENTSYGEIIGSSSAPYINSLPAKGGLATQFYGYTHPSLPNYFVLTAGQDGGADPNVYNDCGTNADCPQSFVSLPEKIEASGRTWKSYFQSMQSNCDPNRVWPYTPHLNPFVYYSRLINSGDCNKNVVNASQFYTDLSNNTLPNFVWLAPDMCNNGHLWTSNSGSCPNGGPYTDYPEAVGQADAWLAANVPKILASPAYQNNGLLIITWDEGDLSTTQDDSTCCGVANGGHIVTLLLSPSITPGTQKAVSETAYSILRTIEDAWSLTPMANEANFNSMSEFFTAPTSQAGDCDNDGHVSITDLSILLSHYGAAYTACDFNKDGVVSVFDLSILLTNYGT